MSSSILSPRAAAWVLAQPAVNIYVNSQNPAGAYGQNVTKGDLLVAHFGCGTAVTLNSITDSQGNLWTIDYQNSAQTLPIAIARAIAGATGPCTVTFNLSAIAQPSIIIFDFSVPGAAPTLDVPVGGANNVATLTPAVGPIVTTQPGDLVIAAMRGGAATAGSAGWTTVFFPATLANAQFIVQGVAGSISAQFTQNNSRYNALIAAYQSPPVLQPGAPVIVQSPAPQTVVTQNLSVSFPSPVAIGDLLVIDLSWATNTGAISQITDTLGSNWQQVDNYSGSSRSNYVFAAIAPKGGTCTLTILMDASRTYAYALYEVSGALTALDGSPIHTNAASGTSAATGTLNTSLPNSVIFSVTKCAAGAAPTVGSPWNSQGISSFATGYQIGVSPGAYSATWTVPGGIWMTTILAFKARVPVTPAVGDTVFSLLAKGNKALGGTGTTPSDNEFTLLAKQFRLLGGAGAVANTNAFVLLARINKQLGGNTTPSDNIFTLLAKQNRLLGGAGALASDTVFTLLAKNSKLL